MLTTFRKFQKGLLIAVTVVIVIAFAFLYSDFDFAKGTLGTTDCVVKVNGRCYRAEEALQLAKFQGLAFNLGMGEFASALRGPNRMDMDPTDFVLNLLVLRKQAERLGIEPSTEEIKEAIPRLPIFQQMNWADGDFIRNFLGRQGMDEGDLAQLMKDFLSFNKLQDLIGFGIQAVPTQVEKSYIQDNQRYTASIVNFDRADFEEQAEVSDEEVKKYYQERAPKEEKPEDSDLEFAENPDAGVTQEEADNEPIVDGELMTAPKRGFAYVKFIPEPLKEDATREETAKRDVTFAKAVNRVYAELADEEADFDKVAGEFSKQEGKAFSMEIGKFEPFTEDEAPEVLAGKQEMLASLFSRTLELDGVTVPLAGDEGSYYVFQFNESVDPRLMSFEEAKPLIIKALKARKSNQLASDAAAEGKAKLQEAIDAGKSILDAASASNFDLVSLPNFSARDLPSDIEDASLVVSAAIDTKEGELSRVMERSGGKGYFIVHVNKIQLYKDEDKEIKEKGLVANAELDTKQKLFQAWLRQRAGESGAQRNNSILNYRPR